MVNVVTVVGCSQGFGKALVEAAFDHPNIVNDNGAIFILITTSKDNTIEMWNELYQRKRGKHFAGDPDSNMKVFVEEANLVCNDDLNRLGEVLRLMFYHIHSTIDQFYVFFNSGSVTPVGPLTDSTIHEFEKATINHCMLNFVSFVMLTRAFVHLALSHKPQNDNVKLRIVNVSSLAAKQGLYGMGVYCAIKAARESIMETLALELSTDFSDKDVRILNYAPGPMETRLVKQDLLGNTAPTNYVKQMKWSSFVDPLESAKKCVGILTLPDNTRSWKNGDHIDFFDQIEF
jgi:NAD(P)-dependent dehydrogenase (short-subunit alcohol dehydrogenase family)